MALNDILEYSGGNNMEELDPIYLATNEGRELNRIRNSLTFNLGLMIVSLLKNPLKIVLLPYVLIKLLQKSRKSSKYTYEPVTDFLVIGLDKTGEYYSNKALDLVNRLQKATNSQVTLISNAQTGPISESLIQWFRLPAARANNYTRKEWNTTVERIISSAICLGKPRKIIFVGEYLYRGIINSLEPIDSKIQQYWFFNDYPDTKHLDNLKFQRIKKICIPSESKVASIPKSMINTRASKNKITFIVDVSRRIDSVMSVLESFPEKEIIGVRRGGERLPKFIRNTMTYAEISSQRYEENLFFIIDESSRVVPELAAVEIPGVLLIEGQIESPIIREMIPDLELHFGLIVARRFNPLDLEETFQYMVTRRHLSGLQRRKDDYLIRWLNSQDRD